MAWKKAGPGRRKLVELSISDQGVITVTKDSGLDIVLADTAKGSIEVLNPRPQIRLERQANGDLKARDLSGSRTLIKARMPDGRIVPVTPSVVQAIDDDED